MRQLAKSSGTCLGTFRRFGRNQPDQGEPGHPSIAAVGPKIDGVGMSRSQLVAEHLPLLRRYARALTGSQIVRRRLCRGHARGPAAGSFAAGREAWGARRAVPAVHPDLEFGLGQRRRRCRDPADAARAAAVQHHAAAAPGLPAAVAGRLPGGGGRLHSRHRCRARRGGSPIRPAARWPPRSPPTC